MGLPVVNEGTLGASSVVFHVSRSRPCAAPSPHFPCHLRYRAVAADGAAAGGDASPLTAEIGIRGRFAAARLHRVHLKSVVR